MNGNVQQVMERAINHHVRVCGDLSATMRDYFVSNLSGLRTYGSHAGAKTRPTSSVWAWVVEAARGRVQLVAFYLKYIRGCARPSGAVTSQEGASRPPLTYPLG